MRVHDKDIEVFVRSSNKENVYQRGESVPLDSGLYCERVMDTRKELLVKNALRDSEWKHNPDIRLGMISYYGLPLTWPTGEIFGTLCILDSKENAYSSLYFKLMRRFRDSVQLSIAALYESHMKSNETAEVMQQVKLLSHAVEQSPVSVVITDYQGSIEYVNQAFELISGYDADEVLGKNPRIFQSGNTKKSLYRELWNTITNSEAWDGELQNRKKDGELYWERINIAPVLDDSGAIKHYVAIKEDITHQKEQEERLAYQAFFDPLTSLPNRTLVLDRLEQMIVDARRNSRHVGVLFLDLDDFKKVNDSLGHEEGDNLLIKAAQRLRESVREGDTVGRFGGDEFVVLLSGLTNATDAQPVANHLLDRFRDVFESNNREFLLTASVGVSVYPEDGATPSDLLRNADSAMYCSKNSGRNTYTFFTASMNKEVSRRLLLEEYIHSALEREEFEVLYQPKIEPRTRKVVGVEALLRWNIPVIDFVSPVEFIPIAEQTGLIDSLGQFVLNESLGKAVQWMELADTRFNVAINLSPRQFRNPELVSSISKSLQVVNLPPDILELEITEGVLMSGHAYVKDALREITDLGITIAMDDFGTGYSSLSYLRQYPFDVLKIDRSFIDDLAVDRADKGLVSAAIAMAHSLNLKVVAEGVETEEQLQILCEYNCDMAQGYLFSRPVTADEISAMLIEQRSTTDH